MTRHFKQTVSFEKISMKCITLSPVEKKKKKKKKTRQNVTHLSPKLTLSAIETKTETYANSVGPDEMACYSHHFRIYIVFHSVLEDGW